MRFLDLELEEAVPMATTIWLFREALAKAGLIDQLFARFGQHLEAGGYIALCVRRQCGAARKRNQGLRGSRARQPHPCSPSRPHIAE
jgi:IS5 family transposase